MRTKSWYNNLPLKVRLEKCGPSQTAAACISES